MLFRKPVTRISEISTVAIYLSKEEEKKREEKREEKISGNNNTMTEEPDDNDQLFATIPKIYFGDGPTIVDSQITQAPDTAAVTAAQRPTHLLPPYFIVFLLILLFLFLGFGAFVYLQRRKDKRKIELK